MPSKLTAIGRPFAWPGSRETRTQSSSSVWNDTTRGDRTDLRRAAAHAGMPWAPTLKALRRVALVTVMETTELRDRDNGSFARVDNRSRHRRVFVQREVCSGAQIVLAVGLQGAT